MTFIELQSKLYTMAQKAEKKNKGKPFQCVIQSEKWGINVVYPAQTDDQAFHIASIGKLISTTALIKLVEAGKCHLEDPLVQYLDPQLLEGLFLSPVETITLEDCLTHRSGANDFFEGKQNRSILFGSCGERTRHPMDRLIFIRIYKRKYETYRAKTSKVCLWGYGLYVCDVGDRKHYTLKST